MWQEEPPDSLFSTGKDLYHVHLKFARFRKLGLLGVRQFVGLCLILSSLTLLDVFLCPVWLCHYP